MFALGKIMGGCALNDFSRCGGCVFVYIPTENSSDCTLVVLVYVDVLHACTQWSSREGGGPPS